jgi:hypothetical protein
MYRFDKAWKFHLHCAGNVRATFKFRVSDVKTHNSKWHWYLSELPNSHFAVWRLVHKPLCKIAYYFSTLFKRMRASWTNVWLASSVKNDHPLTLYSSRCNVICLCHLDQVCHILCKIMGNCRRTDGWTDGRCHFLCGSYSAIDSRTSFVLQTLLQAREFILRVFRL